MNKTNHKIRVGLLFGGRSKEHEVSVLSALSVLEAMDQNKYEVIPIRITKQGRWKLLPDPKVLKTLQDWENHPGRSSALMPTGEGGGLVCPEQTEATQGRVVDVVFPLLHGVFGEDGTVQGMLAMAGVAYIGAEVLGSALGMDKIWMKLAFKEAGLHPVPFWWFHRKAWQEQPDKILTEIEERFSYPCFVKPSNTGSSVGISKAHHREELREAIHQAADLDLKLIVEKAIECRELECGVLGNDNPEASVVGEVIPCREFYDYEAKYQDQNTQTVIPAAIDSSLTKQIRAESIQAFQAIDACGMARVDFFLEKNTHQLYVNEINTIPGFTPRSMFPRLWDASGVNYRELIDRLIQLALDRHEERRKTQGYE